MRETAQSGAATLKSSAEQRLVKQLAAQRRALQTQPVAVCTPVFRRRRLVSGPPLCRTAMYQGRSPVHPGLTQTLSLCLAGGCLRRI